jgi:peptidoglycan/LPS O-acetylase OafA/YrhL
MELSYLPWLRVWAFGLGVTVAWAERVWPRAKEPKLGARQALVALFGVLVLWWCVQTVVYYDAGAFFLQWAIVPVVGAVWIWLAPALDSWAWPAMNRLEQSGGGRWIVIGIGAGRIFGLASYSIYLWHCLVLAGFWQVDQYGTPFLWWTMAFLSVLTGVLSWKYIELRFYSFGGQATAPART